ncbi:MAG TPA: amidohydrolase family protein [Nevskiaceae bacterium]|nr:amidohydrolase family protein [Nevskiaceae bacterium]
MKPIGFAAFLCLLGCTPALALTLDCGRLLDVKSGQWREHVSISVIGARIISVEAQSGKAADHVDLSHYACLPGLIDMHVHLTDQISSQAENFRNQLTLEQTDYAYRSVGYAEKTLLAGFTTVRDLGAERNLNISLKRAIDRGWVRGPRMFTSGTPLGSTGGHADPTDGYKREYAPEAGPRDGIVDSVDDARKAVRQHYKDGADLIKVMVTGGVLDLSASAQNPQLTDAEMQAIVSTAKDYGFRVAVHAHGAEGIKRALRAGADSIEHGTFMDDEAIALFKQHNAWYVPTIIAGKTVAAKAAIDGFFPPSVQPKALAVGPRIQETFGRAYKAGVKIAFGTDAGVYEHGNNAAEFGYMVDAGMPPLDAIRAATLSAAQLLDKSDALGQVETDFLADIIAVEGDPLQDVSTLKSVKFVMKDGVIYKTP